MSFPNPRHSSDSTAEKARKQRCFTSLLHITAAATLPDAGNAMGQSQEHQCKPSQSAHPALLQLFCTSGMAGNASMQPQGWAALRTAAHVLIKPKQLHSCHRNMFVVLQLSVGDVQRASKPWQCISSPFSGPGLHCWRLLSPKDTKVRSSSPQEYKLSWIIPNRNEHKCCGCYYCLINHALALLLPLA